MLQSKGSQRVERDLGIEQQQRLIFNFVLVSGIHHSKSVVCVCVCVCVCVYSFSDSFPLQVIIRY